MDLKPRTLLRFVVDLARTEIERRVGGRKPPRLPAEAREGTETSASPEEVDPPLVTERISAELVRARWRVSEAREARAVGTHGIAGPRTVRCVVFYVDRRGAPRRELRERVGIAPEGVAEWAVPAGARCVVAVGLGEGDTFVAVAHGASARR